jgi:hypothetical protein
MDLEAGNRSLMKIFDFSDCLFQHLVNGSACPLQSLDGHDIAIDPVCNSAPEL